MRIEGNLEQKQKILKDTRLRYLISSKNHDSPYLTKEKVMTPLLDEKKIHFPKSTQLAFFFI